MNSIPKIIHQIWIGPKPEPTIWTNTFKIDYIKQNPEYKYMLWNNENINELFLDYPIYKRVFDLEKWYCGKADILRYLILYKFGGIYIDADTVWLNNKSFDNLIDNCEYDIFVAKEPNNNIMANSVIGSIKEHPVFLQLIKHIENYIIENGKIKKLKFLRLASYNGASKLLGPLLFDAYVSKIPITVYPSEYFYPIIWHGIIDINYHLNNEISKEAYMFQYGYSTNNLENKFNN